MELGLGGAGGAGGVTSGGAAGTRHAQVRNAPLRLQEVAESILGLLEL